MPYRKCTTTKTQLLKTFTRYNLSLLKNSHFLHNRRKSWEEWGVLFCVKSGDKDNVNFWMKCRNDDDHQDKEPMKKFMGFWLKKAIMESTF